MVVAKMASETAAYRLTRSKSNLICNFDTTSSCHDSSSLLLGSEKSMNSSLMASTCNSYYNRSHTFSNSSSSSSSSNKNNFSSFSSSKYYTLLITSFLCFLLLSFLLIAYCSFEPPMIQGPFKLDSSSLAASWQQHQQQLLGRNPHLLITFPHTPLNRVLESDATGSSNSSRSRSRSSSSSSSREVLRKEGFFAAVAEEHEREEHGAALQGMGQLFRRGRWAMSELVVAHLAESTSVEDLRLFLRSLHCSGVPARADVVLLFPWRPLPPGMAAMIDQEDESFRELLLRENSSSSSIGDGFNAAAYWRSVDAFSGSKSRASAEPVWGSRSSSSSSSAGTDSTAAPHRTPASWRGWGSVVGFDLQELDPANALRGFLENPPSELRRWVCYQILLGMVRHKFRNVLLTEAQGVFVLQQQQQQGGGGDPLGPARRKAGSLFLFALDSRKWSDPSPLHQLQTQKVISTEEEESLQLHQNTSSTLPRPVGLIEEIYGTEVWNGLEKEEKERKVLSTGFLMGGIRPMRSLANAMATEVVKVALRRKTRQPFHDEALLNYLIFKSSVLRQKVKSHLHLMDIKEMPFRFLLPGSHESDHTRPHAGAATHIEFHANA
ncbi:unnamed protein product [Sphagnum troendelagicum]|uniref:DUF7780 domain-containing protein n=1 Tax=Sphagnum troendelagicum TaxID=128251 RepID=A0ABP0UYR3_9BRYO